MLANCRKYTQTSMKRLRAAYTNAYRIMHRIARNISACPHQVNHCVRTFDALLRNNLYRFIKRYATSSNFFILSLQMPVFYKSSLFLHYSRGRRLKTKVDFCVRSYLFRSIVSSFLASESVTQETVSSHKLSTIQQWGYFFWFFVIIFLPQYG